MLAFLRLVSIPYAVASAAWGFVRSIGLERLALVATLALVGLTLLLTVPTERGLAAVSFVAVGLSGFHLGRSSVGPPPTIRPA